MIYFCTEEFLKTKTQITQNVSAQDLAPYLQISSEMYVRPILGYNFYNDILTKYNAGTLSADEQILVDFIQYIVAFYAAYEAVPNLTYRISNKGIQSQSGEFSASEGIEVLEYIRRNIYKFGKIKEDEMRAYLAENATLYPAWSTDNNDIVIPDTDKRNNNGGISSI